MRAMMMKSSRLAGTIEEQKQQRNEERVFGQWPWPVFLALMAILCLN